MRVTGCRRIAGRAFGKEMLGDAVVRDTVVGRNQMRVLSLTGDPPPIIDIGRYRLTPTAAAHPALART
ncbi:hypothetical protein [Methylobacterium sp. B4]|uniref:hypothetical protein n=1 Tax=Methylobacterium sp. B4 TaxID=1938755 RepID=UPI0011B79E02|nr:hypothetical protein [Methylobacterium sp. B4]